MGADKRERRPRACRTRGGSRGGKRSAEEKEAAIGQSGGGLTDNANGATAEVVGAYELINSGAGGVLNGVVRRSKKTGGPIHKEHFLVKWGRAKSQKLRAPRWVKPACTSRHTPSSHAAMMVMNPTWPRLRAYAVSVASASPDQKTKGKPKGHMASR